MKHYTLYTTRYSQAFKEYITNTELHPSEFIDKWEEIRIGNETCFTYNYTKKDKVYALEKMAHIISNIVQEEVLKSFTKHYLKKRMDLNKKEKKEISNMVLLNHYMDREQGASYLSYYLIYTPILKALETYEKINIEGWINFQMKPYKIMLEDILEQTIYDYDTQKDYLDFILLLRENQKIQQTLTNEIHLLATEKGEMRLLNSVKEDKTKFYKARYCLEMLEEDITEEDKILNILMTLSPEKIIVHHKDYFQSLQFIETLELVFLNKVVYYSPAKDY